MRQAIEPIGQARGDFAIFTDLARRLGCEGAYAEGRDEMAWLRHLYESWRSKVRTNQSGHPAFWKEGFTKIRVAATSTCFLANFVRIRTSTGLPHYPAESSFIPSALPASATMIARRIQFGSNRTNGSAPLPPRPIRFISYRASHVTDCIARWIQER